jgi:eukaryotic-like serine/threonine-protein kinase
VADLRERLQSGLADRYRIERELGRGGMATVFLALDLRHKRLVALKVLHPELAQTLGPERFQREIETVARLQHPHILTVHDSGETAGQLWFTMPFVEGESLRDRLRRDQQLPVEVALRIATDAARALEYAHDHGVIHRDIKPENLLLTKDGSTLVADFGIARALSAGDDRLTETGLSVGTPAYMSPEQAAGDRTLDARTDVYALGAVLYEMLAGEPPFTGPTAQAIIAKRFSGEVPRVRHVRPSVPESVEQAVIRALAPVPADRFASAAEFARALQPTVIAPTTSPTDPLAPARGSATGRVPGRARRQVPVAAMALVLGVLIGLGVLFAWRRSHPGGDDERGGVKRVAVLPFENLGDSSDAYFADGLSDDVRGKLSQIAGLAVIARASSNEYRHTSKAPQEIARELGAEYLLTATVRWEKHPDGTSRVRVSPELVRIQPGAVPTTKWQQGFDAALTDVFKVQADIASEVSEALDVALSDSTRRELAVKPTQNLDAYDAYLRGKEIRSGEIAPGVLHAAEAEFQRATALDSTFAAAWADLATTHILLFRTGGMQIRDAQAAAREVERATALGPGLPDVRAAKGRYQEVVRGDVAGALREYEAGLRAAPNRGDLLGLVSGAEATLGRSAAALSHLEQATRLDPRSPGVAAGLSGMYFDLRRYAEARAALDRARALRPSSLSLIYTQALLHAVEGDLAGARHALQLAHQVTDSTTVVAYVALREDLLWLLDDAQQRLLLTLTPAALDGGRADWALALAETYWRRGDRNKARAYADTAGVEYRPLIRDALNPADRAQLAGLQALALAYLGKAQEGVEKGNEALNAAKLAAAPIGQRSYIQFLLARIYLLAEQPEKALDQLEPLLKTTGSRVSPGWLKIDPTFAPLRGNPRFDRLLEGKT